MKIRLPYQTNVERINFTIFEEGNIEHRNIPINEKTKQNNNNNNNNKKQQQLKKKIVKHT